MTTPTHRDADANPPREDVLVERIAELEAVRREADAFSHATARAMLEPLSALDEVASVVPSGHAVALGEEAVRLLTNVRRCAAQLARLSDDLLTFASLGLEPLARQRVATGEVVNEAFEALQSERTGRNLGLSIDALPECLADPTLLRHVFIALLSHAIASTHGREWGEIHVGHHSARGEDVFIVMANGALSEMEDPNAPPPADERTPESPPRGTTLALVKRIVHHHGGRLWSEVTPGFGSAFHFTLGNHPAS